MTGGALVYGAFIYAQQRRRHVLDEYTVSRIILYGEPPRTPPNIGIDVKTLLPRAQHTLHTHTKYNGDGMTKQTFYQPTSVYHINLTHRVKS